MAQQCAGGPFLFSSKIAEEKTALILAEHVNGIVVGGMKEDSDQSRVLV